jgi:hypothetical protein
MEDIKLSLGIPARPVGVSPKSLYRRQSKATARAAQVFGRNQLYSEDSFEKEGACQQATKVI